MAEYQVQKTPQEVSVEPFYDQTQAVPVAEVVESVENVKVGAWEVDICGCFSSCVPNCCMASFLPCISVAQIAARVGIAKYSITLIVYAFAYMGVYICMSIPFLFAREEKARVYTDDIGTIDYEILYVSRIDPYLYFYCFSLATFFNLALFIGLWLLRSKIRHMFQLPGGCCDDCCISFCCPCCSIAQLATHVKSYTPGNCYFGAPDVLPGYDVPLNRTDMQVLRNT
jgi:Cys-rich protein (TIGR01571 family)